jgi:hypothetical protein
MLHALNKENGMEKAKAIELVLEALGVHHKARITFIKINHAGIQAHIAHFGPITYGLEAIHYNAKRKVGFAKWPEKKVAGKKVEHTLKDSACKRLHVIWHMANRKEGVK